MSRYSVGEFIRTAWALLLTRMFFPGARLVRRPVYIRRGNQAIFGPGLTTGYRCRFDLGGGSSTGITLTIGRNCRMGDSVQIVASGSVRIGDDCLLASNIFISDTGHGDYQGPNASPPEQVPNDRPLSSRPVVIGDRVWIGENVCVLPGAELGSGCIVSAGAVVTKTFGPNLILAGVPARPIKKWADATREWVAL